MKPRFFACIALALTFVSPAFAQPPLFTDALPAAEFAARRARVLEQIGDAAVVMQGTDELPTYQKFRQSNQFFYLTGVEVPRAILVIDGRAKSSTLFLNPRDERAERSEGPVLTPGPEAEQITGVTSVRPRGEFAAVLAQLAGEGRTLFMPHRPEALGAATPGYTLAHAQRSLEDPWDGRLSREAAFIARVKEKAPTSPVKDLDPVLDAMRLVKSPREIALIREATRIAGLGIMEAMRSAEPGMYESSKPWPTTCSRSTTRRGSVTSRSSLRARTPAGRTITPPRAGSTMDSWSSSTMRPTSSTTPPT